MSTPDASSAAHIADTIIAAYGEHRDHIICTPAAVPGRPHRRRHARP